MQLWAEVKIYLVLSKRIEMRMIEPNSDFVIKVYMNRCRNFTFYMRNLFK